jgi:hypothetical protein
MTSNKLYLFNGVINIKISLKSHLDIKCNILLVLKYNQKIIKNNNEIS